MDQIQVDSQLKKVRWGKYLKLVCDVEYNMVICKFLGL